MTLSQPISLRENFQLSPQRGENELGRLRQVKFIAQKSRNTFLGKRKMLFVDFWANFLKTWWNFLEYQSGFQICKRCQNIIGNICTKSFNQKWLKILDILPTSVGNVFVFVENLSKIIPNEWKRHLRSKCAPLLRVVTWARSRSIEVNHYVHCTYLNIYGGL